MTLKELKELVNKHYEYLPEYSRDDIQVRVSISKPSIGPRATAAIRSVSKGIDWDSNTFFIHPEEPLVVKSKNESLWDAALDFICVLANTKTKTGKLTHNAEHARRILEKAGYKLPDLGME